MPSDAVAAKLFLLLFLHNIQNGLDLHQIVITKRTTQAQYLCYFTVHYATLWSVILPLKPSLALIDLVFRLPFSGLKICLEQDVLLVSNNLKSLSSLTEYGSFSRRFSMFHDTRCQAFSFPITRV